MKKTYKIDVDCANCARELEEELNAIGGVKSEAYGRNCNGRQP